MKYRRIWAAVVFTFAVMASISACGNGNTAETTGTSADSTGTTTETAAVTENTATAANETTTADTTEAIETATPDTDNSGADSSDSVTADIDPSKLIGKWVDKDSGWSDTYFFDYNGNGSYTSGFESTFTYSVEGNVLTVFYAEDDIDIFTAVLNHDTLTLVDEYEYEQRFERVTEDTAENTEDSSNPNADAIIGTWKESETGNDETFTFNADGTGHCSRLSSDGSYECDFTYNFFRNNFIDIYYDDGNIDGFLIAIEGDKMTVKNDFIQETVYTRQ